MVGVHKKPGCTAQRWGYSKPVIMPESDLQDFSAELLKLGFRMFDVREQAAKETPGMEKATPILFYGRNPGATLKDAVSAFEVLHRAILASEIE